KALIALAASDVRHEFWIGINIAEADATLRSQLRLPKNQGLVVTGVLPDSPAAKAELAVNDLLLTFGKEPLGRVEELIQGIQSAGEKEIEVNFLRGGEQHTRKITPGTRDGGSASYQPLTLVRTRTPIGESTAEIRYFTIADSAVRDAGAARSPET